MMVLPVFLNEAPDFLDELLAAHVEPGFALFGETLLDYVRVAIRA